ncbi:hypothetical protein BGZ57DRAFT_779482, partial [Hyaloscypha finlandica]
GNLTIPLPNKDLDIIIILLNIIYRLLSKVPRQVSLNMLSRLVITVNHWYIHEAIEL